MAVGVIWLALASPGCCSSPEGFVARRRSWNLDSSGVPTDEFRDNSTGRAYAHIMDNPFGIS